MGSTSRSVRPSPPPPGDPAEPRWATRTASKAIGLLLVPFVLAFATAGYQRLDRWHEAERALDRVHGDLAGRLGPDAEAPWVTVERMVTELYGEPATRTPERARFAERYRELALATAYEWRAAYRALDPAVRASPDGPGRAWDRARERASTALRNGLVAALVVQLFAVFLVPGLTIMALLRARREIRRDSATAGTGFASFARAIRHQRNRLYLAGSEHMLFWRRLAFGAVLTQGTTYVLSPRGILASSLGDYAATFPVPGMPSHPFFIDHFRDAPLLVTGFTGYLLYVFVTSLQRAFSRDLTDRFTLSLFNRGLVVALLGLVLSSIGDGGDAARALVFVVGIFPQRGIEWLSAKAAVAAASPWSTAGFEALPSLDEAKQASLREVGIDGVADLARCDLERVVVDVGIDPGVLCRAVDRALLIDTFGVEAVAKLDQLPVRTASELVLFVDIAPDALDQLRGALDARDRAPQKLDVGRLARRADAERQALAALVAAKLGAAAIDGLLAALERDANVRYLLHQQVAFVER